jgi:hypothetical protein
MSVRRTTLLVLSAAALGFATQTATASAAVRPMTFDECGTNGGSGVYNCMYISGGGLSATEIRGWSTDFATLVASNYGRSVPVHEQVTGPNGTICNSPTVSVSSNSQIVSCQLSPGGSFPIAAGTYCSIVWSADGLDGEYVKLAENCGTASA